MRGGWKPWAPCLLAALSLAWLDPARDRIADANRLFERGDYAGAVEKYGQSLVDDPDSPLLNFNMGTAHYKAGNYAEAAASFGRVHTEDNPSREARTAYNLGNTHYRAGAAAEAQDPQQAVQGYTAALVAYRRAIVLNPTDDDAKFNYEFVTRKIEELKNRQNEEQQQDQQQNQEQQSDSEEGEQSPEQQQESDAKSQEEGEDREQQASGTDEAQEEDEQQPQSETAGTDGESDTDTAEQEQRAARTTGEEREMSPHEAAALLDTATDDELQPDEFARQIQGAVVAEPAQDW